MAEHKNQHFVPRCHFKPFTSGQEGKAINLFNIRQAKTIPKVSVKGQCSKNYFYGADLTLEKSFQNLEGNYSTILQKLLTGSETTHADIGFLADFAYFQSRRTQVAIDRMRESANIVEDAVFEGHDEQRPNGGLDDDSLIKDSLKMFFESRHYIEDLKKCFVRNETVRSFVTSDDPAIITNKFFMQKFHRSNFGLASSGAMLLMPLSPIFLLLCYDGGVYTIPDKQNGFVIVKKEADVFAFNELQYLKASENVYFENWAEAAQMKAEFEFVKPRRPESWMTLTKLVQFSEDDEGANFRKATDQEFLTAPKTMVLQSASYPPPSSWPSPLKFRNPPKTFSNGSGIGLVRKKEYLQR